MFIYFFTLSKRNWNNGYFSTVINVLYYSISYRLIGTRKNGCCNCWSEIRFRKWTNPTSRLPPYFYQCCCSTFFIINILPSIYNHIYYLHLLTSSHSWTFNVSLCYLSISLPCYALVVGILKQTCIHILILILYHMLGIYEEACLKILKSKSPESTIVE